MMRPSARRRGLRHDDEGVSVVVSAVLVFALIIMVVAVYSGTIVPDQIREAEAAHMRNVDGALSNLASRLSQASSLTGGGQFSQQVDLGTTSVPFFSAVESSGRLAVFDAAFFSSLSCNETKLVARDGAAAPGAAFDAATGSLPVTEVLVLEFRVDAYAHGGTDDTATIAASGPDGAALGSLELTLGASSATVRTRDGSGAIVVDQVVQSEAVDVLRIDALDRIFGFSSLLEDAQGEKTLTFSASDPAVTVYAVGRADDGAIVTKGSGRTLPVGFARAVNSATLVYASQNHRFMDQTYALEGGSIVVSQPSGEFLSVATFQIVTGTAGDPYLRLGMVNLTGTGDTVGTHSATVSAVVRPPVVSIVECTDPRVLVTSQYQGAWAAAWGQELRRAGLGATPLTSTSAFVAVSLPGTWIVELTETRADLRVS